MKLSSQTTARLVWGSILLLIVGFTLVQVAALKEERPGKDLKTILDETSPLNRSHRAPGNDWRLLG